MTKLAVFDLDGTLLNTLEDLAMAGNVVLKRHGLPVHPVEAYRQFVGNGVQKLVERMTPEEIRTDKELMATLKTEYDTYYAAHNQDHTKPYPEIPALLTALCQRGITCAVLSNKPHEFTSVLCKKYFLGQVSLSIGHRQGYPHKPDRSLMEELYRKTGCWAADTVYLGDSGVDMQTAKNADAYAVGVLWGFRGEQELRENGADVLIKEPMELWTLLEKNT